MYRNKLQILLMILVLTVTLAACGAADSSESADASGNASADVASADASGDESSEPIASEVVDYFAEGYTFETSDATQYLAVGDDTTIVSNYVMLVDADTNEIVAYKNGDEKMYPASMTKVMSLLIDCENISYEDLDDTFTMDYEIGDYCVLNDCSAVGLTAGETVPIGDLFYGLILPSGADAALGLANYAAGSHEAFVDLMNQKCQELGISDSTHFMNCVGIYDENHYSTCRDMCVIMKAALENYRAYETMQTHVYTITPTDINPDGIRISNWFLRRIEDYIQTGTVVAGKTGYVAQSGSCAVSYFVSNTGHHYILCTGQSSSSWQCIYDQVYIYDNYTE